MAQMRVEDVPARIVAVVRRTVPSAEVSAFVADAFGTVPAAVADAGGIIVGPPFAWYCGTPTDIVDVAAGYAVDGLPLGELAGDVVVLERPGGMSAEALTERPDEDLAHTYRELEVWLRDRALDVGDESWEEYGDGADDGIRIVWPLV